MYLRNDEKVRAELVFDNGEIACYYAMWDDIRRLTSCTSARFARDFTNEPSPA